MPSIRKEWQLWFYPVLLGISSIPVIYPLTGGGYILTHDQYFPIHRLLALHQTLLEGQIPPRWTNLFAMGYGYPFFNFYAPLAYYVAEFIFFLTQNYLLSVHITFGIGLIIGGLGTYLWIKNILGKNAALVVGILYVYYPYHLVNAYVRGDISELMASAWFPWVFWSADRLIRASKLHLKYLLSSSVFYSFVMLSHNIMAMLFTGFYLLYGIFLLWSEKKYDRFIYWIVSLIWGLGISLYFWLPAFIEKKYVQIQSLLKAAPYQEHFIQPFQLVDLHWGYGGVLPLSSNSMSLQMGILPLVLIALSPILILLDKKRDRLYFQLFFFFCITLLLFIYLMLPISQFVWSRLPLLQYTLFPWRFLSLIGIPIVFLSGVTIYYVCSKISIPMYRNLFLVGICLLIIGADLPYLKRRQIALSPAILQKQNIWTIEMLSKTFGTTMSNEYVPKWVHEMPSRPVESLLKSSDESPIIYFVKKYSSTEQKYQVVIQQSSRVICSTFYYPEWSVLLDGKTVPWELTHQGLISLNIPAGQHILELILKETPIHFIANWISGLSILLFVIVSLWGMSGWYRKYKSEKLQIKSFLLPIA